MMKNNFFKKTFHTAVIFMMMLVNTAGAPALAQDNLATESAIPVATPSPTLAPPLPENIEQVMETTAPLQNLTDTQHSQGSALIKQQPKIHSLAKYTYSAGEEIRVSAENIVSADLSVRIYKKDGSEIDVDRKIVRTQDPAIISFMPKSQVLDPGLYTLEVNDPDGHAISQDFVWGVLAINTDKATYSAGEKVNFSMAVLDDTGKMVCDAKVSLKITSPDGGQTVLSTEGGTVKINPECKTKDFTLIPDYEAEFVTGAEGTYAMELSAETANGTRSITDNLEVSNDVPFIISRSSATRIFPPHVYPVRLTITAREDFNGLINEVVPDGFEISHTTEVDSYDSMNSVLATKLVQADGLATLSGKLRLPFDGDHAITANFGEYVEDKVLREKYEKYGLSGHDGIDFDLPEGTPVISVDEGQVIKATENGDYGTTIVVEHAWGRSYYGHLSKLVKQEGEQVKAGDEIGLSGSTGLSTGPHLHFGIKSKTNDAKNGYFGKINPIHYLVIGEGSRAFSSLRADKELIKVLTWKVNIKKGETVTLGYNFRAPQVSPQFYLLGPLRFYNTVQDDAPLYEEARQWQIAADDIANYTVNFATDIEGYSWISDSCTGTCTQGYTGADGNPAGSLEVSITGRNDDNWGYFSNFLTWEDMGVPAGATVNSVNGSFDYRHVTETHAATQSIGLMLYDSSDTTSIISGGGDLETVFDPGATSGSWATRDTDGAKNISASYQASNTTITIRMRMDISSGANNSANSVTRADTLAFTIDYTPAPPGPTNDQIMRHGAWFNGGVEQPFTF